MTIAPEKLEVPEGLQLLSIADYTGDFRLMWNPNKKAERKAAETAFNDAIERGLWGYKVDETSGEKTREVIREFDPEAGKIIMAKQAAGG